jgi:chemotaxis protein MotB
VQTSIEPRGLVIRVLTDDLLFASGQATLSNGAASLMDKISQLLQLAGEHPIDVEGNTDNVPIHSSQYPSNWELSTARASTVVRYLVGQGIAASRLTAMGYADEHPIASDATAAGRARNRRVEIVLQRVDTGEGES